MVSKSGNWIRKRRRRRIEEGGGGRGGHRIPNQRKGSSSLNSNCLDGVINPRKSMHFEINCRFGIAPLTSFTHGEDFISLLCHSRYPTSWLAVIPLRIYVCVIETTSTVLLDKQRLNNQFLLGSEIFALIKRIYGQLQEFTVEVWSISISKSIRGIPFG